MSRFGCIVSLFFCIIVVFVGANDVQVCIRQPPLRNIAQPDTDTFTEFLSRKLFVDKTKIITEFASDQPLEKNVCLITFSRRFGKSVNLLLFEFFFGIEIDANGAVVPQHSTKSYNFFKHGKVLDDSYKQIAEFKPAPLLSHSIYDGIIRAHLARYPVIYFELKALDLVPVHSHSFENFLKKFHAKIQNTFERHRYLIKYFNEKMASTCSFERSEVEENKEMFLKLLSRHSHPPPTSDDLVDSLKFLSKVLRGVFSQKVIILLDEYDTIWNSLYLYGRYFPDPTLRKKIEEFYQSFLLSTIGEDKSSYIQIYLTGVLKIQNENIFSNLNYFTYYNMLSPNINKYYGVSRKEASILFDIYKIPLEDRTIIQSFYDGYKFPVGGDKYEQYYNIFSITNYLNTIRPKEKIPTAVGYWSGSGIISSHFRRLMVSPAIKQRLQSILFQECTCLEMVTGTSYSDLLSFGLDVMKNFEAVMMDPTLITENELLINYFLQLLFATGYFTPSEQKTNCFEFPNEEVKTNVQQILINHYVGSFIQYSKLAGEFEEFLFDDKLRSQKFEQTFSNFVLINQFELKEHLRPSYSVGTTATIDSKNGLTLEVNEAFFAGILHSVALKFRSNKYVAFEKKTDEGSIDIFVHDGNKQAIVELKYKGSGYSLKHAITQSKKYHTEFPYSYKFIGILGHLNGSIETVATFERSV